MQKLVSERIVYNGTLINVLRLYCQKERNRPEKSLITVKVGRN